VDSQIETKTFRNPLTTRQVFTIHLVLSILVFSSLVFVMVAFWFPGELFLIDGGWAGLKLVAMVDLVLGPLLTLILYKPSKSKLAITTDIVAIATIQIGALIYGFVTTYDQRTIALVYADKTFNTISQSAHQIANNELREFEITPRNIPDIDDNRPAMLLTPPPTPEKFADYLLELVNDYPGPHERSDQYVTLASSLDTIRDYALDDAKLEQLGMLTAVEKAVKRGGFDKENIEYHYFKARYAKGIAVLDVKRGEILDYIRNDEGTGRVAQTTNAQAPE